MGLSHSWVAVRSGDRAAILADLKVEVVAELEEDDFPRFGVAALPGGWTLILSDNFDWAFKSVQAVSRHGLAVACAEEEHVMVSDACAYDGGALVWRVLHDSEKDNRGLEVSGAPPSVLPAIREAAYAAQTESDAEDDGAVDHIFGVPPKVAQEIVGFRITEGADEPLVFSELRKIKGPGLLSRLLGRR